MSKWQVELTRHQFDLEDLPKWFTAPELRVVERDGHFLLEADQFDDLNESAAVHAAARELLPRINGVAKLKNGSFRYVAVGGRVATGPSSSTSPMCPNKSSGSIRALISGCSANVGSSFLQWSRHGAGIGVTSSRMCNEQGENSSALYVRVHRGRRSTS
jgi:hypothetical protein